METELKQFNAAYKEFKNIRKDFYDAYYLILGKMNNFLMTKDNLYFKIMENKDISEANKLRLREWFEVYTQSKSFQDALGELELEFACAEERYQKLLEGLINVIIELP